MASLAAPRTATFVITAERCPQILCRLIGLVAQQGRIVEQMELRATRRIVHVSLSVADIDVRRAEIIAEKIVQLVGVRTLRRRIA